MENEENPYEKGQGKHQRLYDYLSGEFHILLDQDELEHASNMAYKDITHLQNIGIRVARIDDNDRERAFHEQWLKENRPDAGVNHGYGILQDLFIEGGMGPFSQRKVIHHITQRDREIVATVVQWLGSNVGFGFLQDALRKCGYYIVKKDDEKK